MHWLSTLSLHTSQRPHLASPFLLVQTISIFYLILELYLLHHIVFQISHLINFCIITLSIDLNHYISTACNHHFFFLNKKKKLSTCKICTVSIYIFFPHQPGVSDQGRVTQKKEETLHCHLLNHLPEAHWFYSWVAPPDCMYPHPSLGVWEKIR